jgi:tRNA (guanine26-N2/guanine27-N2)-dimethyltransferase
MWGGPLHSPDFVMRFLDRLPRQSTEVYCTIPRITGMLKTVLDESSLENCPFFHIPSRLSRVLHCEAPPLAAVRGALVGLGYKVAQSHCRPSSLKTDAPQSVMWEVMKKWIELKPITEGSLKPTSAGTRILERPRDSSLEIKLDQKLGRDLLKDSGVIRYQINPTANWGPMGRASGSGRQTPSEAEDTPSKRLRYVVSHTMIRSL